ncbi:MAG: MFS transporter [Dactylosporangium sp.]|nr:MFS transporter [Dactylosporangium sp.]NNJ63340.1 MFS transporter [Dactylosporangium sp.]
MSDTAPPLDVVRRARRDITLAFAIHGAATGTFATRIPWIAEHLHLDAGALGIALAAPAIGATVAMPTAGRVVHRFGGRAAVTGLLAMWCAALSLPALAPSLPALFVALLLFGATSGMADVSINGQAVRVEGWLGRSIMASFHGTWSLGGLAGSAIGTLAAHADLDARIHFGLVTAILGASAVVVGLRLPTGRPAAGAKAPPRFALPPRITLWLCVVGFCAIFAEGAAGNWSAVYLADTVGASAGMAAAGYTGFALAIAGTRFLGDLVVRRIGPVRTVRLSGVVAAVGATVVVVARSPVPVAVGFILLGVGVAVVVPLTFAAVGRMDLDASHAIAGVATVTYSSNLFAPAVIGGIARFSSLSVSFGLVALLTLGIVARAGALRPRAASVTAPGGGTAAAPSGAPVGGE